MNFSKMSLVTILAVFAFTACTSESDSLLQESVGAEVSDLDCFVTGECEIGRVYEHANFEGEVATQWLGRTGLAKKAMNDKISSLTVQPGFVLLLCDPDYYDQIGKAHAGPCKEFGEGDHPYVGDDFNDRTSMVWGYYAECEPSDLGLDAWCDEFH